MIFLKYTWCVLLALGLAACGGGGAPAGGGNAKPTLVAKIYATNNAVTTNVTYGSGNYIKASFRDAAGLPIVGKIVTFALSGSEVAKLSADTALTNSTGEAQVFLSITSASSSGALSWSAAASYLGASYSDSGDFSVSPADIALGTLSVGSASLNAGGNTSVSVTAQSKASASPSAGVSIALFADCGTIEAVTTTNGSGTASATYSAVKADGTSCSGSVRLTASLAGSDPQALNLTVAAATANAINFLSAEPAQIFVKASGANEQSFAKFKVLDSLGNAMANIPVVFSLTVNPGGVGIGQSGSTNAVTSNSDGSGVASVSIFSGTVPGPVEVKAALQTDATVFRVTRNLTVASGPPSQNRFSLSVSTYNIEGADIDGTSTTLTMRVADRQGNPVPDGTVINFTSEGGQIEPSCVTARVGGIALCSVGFVSQQPRPADGRVSVLAHAEGLKEFLDVNGNNAYDIGTDSLAPDLGDAYRDDNENGQFDSGEFVIQRGGALTCAGSGPPAPSRANTCTGTSTLAATVRSQTVLLMASSFADVTVITAPTNAVETSAVVRINSIGSSLLPMATGTTVTGAPVSAVSGCIVNTVFPALVPSIGAATVTAQLGSTHTIGLTSCAGQSIVITIKSPSGQETASFLSVPP